MTDRIERLLPNEIERRSFEIIEEELNKKGIVLPEENSAVIKRTIHTSADFEYAKTLKFSEDAVRCACDLIRNGADIVTDTNMAMSGINKKFLSSFGGSVHCFMADEDVAKEAEERGVTRAYVSMERAAKLNKKTIFAVGNAPTALVRLYEMYKSGDFTPDFIIGVPVGFVNVEVSKELIMSTDIPYIVNEGRKGGSNIAAAVCNALLYQMKER